MSDTDLTAKDERETTRQLGLGMIGGGVLAAVIGLATGSKALRFGGLVAGLGGAALLMRARLEERQEQIVDAEEHIRSELDQLDPVARAQVIAELADG